MLRLLFGKTQGMENLEKYTAKTFKVEKIYKKGEEWKSTDHFDLNELLQLRAALDKAIMEEGVKIKSGNDEK